MTPPRSGDAHCPSARQQGYVPLPDPDDQPSNPSREPSFTSIVERRLSRRDALRLIAGATAGLAGVAAGCTSPETGAGAGDAAVAMPVGGPSTTTFEEIAAEISDTHQVAPGHDVQVLIRYGDAVAKGAPAFEPGTDDPAAHARQFGYNNDYIAFMPLPRGSSRSDHGLLCVNHEYTNPELMFPGVTSPLALTDDQLRCEMAAHGHTVLEIKLQGGQWRVVEGSPYNRRITAGDTVMAIRGPAAGSVRMQTADDPTGTRVVGTINNCAGGYTPWGTVLMAEENFHLYFTGDPANVEQPERRNLERYGFGDPRYGWGGVDPRFDIEQAPREANRFGWVVEFDPYDPKSMPVKRTALGRFKHEGATVSIAPDGRAVLYSGDDQRFDYLYRFVSRDRFDPANPGAAKDLLDEGELSVAKFEPDGVVRWLPLVHGRGPLTAANGFDSQADVLIETRRAADLLGATPMDRPEDVEPNPLTGKVYVMLTNNTKRTEAQTDAANPRADNRFGHVAELIPPGAGVGRGDQADHTAPEFRWELFLLAGNPAVDEHDARYHPAVTENGWLSSPDNCAFDQKGRIWIATDQGSSQRKTGLPDGVRVADTEGEGRALTRLFFTCPRDSEMCGPCFTPDSTTLFLAVQHPGEGSDYAQPSTRWPDFDERTPPRPAVVAVRRTRGGPLG